MADFILFMHDDTPTTPAPGAWAAYFAKLRDSDMFAGGSAIGIGETFRKHAPPGATSSRLSGYIRIRADDFAAARDALTGNPVFESGGTVEIRELPPG